ncbi:PREDICTED: mastermind-like domain-containing protein 1 isoform X1 [Condylura cristata]|uniref:mastermind-like domain-containing protein 1 isoform X1 n=1 Tax=Condylura cristata TaxID=143302 RepID=UPI000642A306|nr:PREDICTED: mastermind-like domain-containing protein 1 isoform X1 [Condylura cristata]
MDDWKSRLVIKSMLPHFAMVGNRQEPRKLQESPQGTVKRRQEGDSFQFAGMADGGYPNKIKRPCLEDVTLAMGQGARVTTACAELQVAQLAMSPSPAAMGVAGHALLLDSNPMNGSVTGLPFADAPPAEMGLKAPPVPYYDKSSSSSLPAVDQELQELLDELTKIQEPSPSDLDLEKILGTKPEEPLVLDHPQATLGATAKTSVQMPHLESLSSRKEFASSCSQATGMSLPIPPSNAGLSYAVSSAGKQMAPPGNAAAQPENPAPPMLPVAVPPLPMPQWHHAHQLKVLAASKQGSATKLPGPAAGWSGLPPPGLSPPYRPVPSPHPPPPPFSPQSLMVSCLSSSNLPGAAVQGSPNALLSSMAPGGSATLGPALPYAPEKLPSPALQPPPPFSSQNSILANLVSSTVKSPPGHLLSTLPASTQGPSPPYRPEKLASPSLPQQSFTPQCPLIRSLAPAGTQLGPQPPPPQSTNAIFKPMSAGSSKTLSMIMQQGLASPSPGAPEPFSFGSTKPLSHFASEPGPQKMPALPTASRQQSLLHYLQQPAPASASVPTASPPATATLKLQPQPDHAPYLLQQMMQPPPRGQRALASESAPSLPRQSHVDKACKLGEARPPQASLGRQAPSCQALGSESFLPGGSSFAHELARVTSAHSTSQAAPWGGWDPKAWRQAPAPLLPSCHAGAREAEIRSYGNDP